MNLHIDVAPAKDDAIRPFQVDALDIRGRAIQMGPVLDAILSRHDYPAPVSRLLGEAIVLAVLLGSSLKSDARFTLQTKTDGAVSMLVVDYRANGDIRAHASFAPDAVAAAATKGSGALLGKGVLAMTIDQGALVNRYQGVVQLDGNGLEAVAHEYFRQSEQIPTKVRLAVAELHARDGGSLRRSWRAGGLIAQFLPEAPERMRRADLPGGDAPDGAAKSEIADDAAWVEARSLVATIEDHELLDPGGAGGPPPLSPLPRARRARVRRAAGCRPVLVLTRAGRRHSPSVHGGGGRGEHRGRHHLGEVRILRDALRLRSGRIRELSFVLS